MPTHPTQVVFALCYLESGHQLSVYRFHNIRFTRLALVGSQRHRRPSIGKLTINAIPSTEANCARWPFNRRPFVCSLAFAGESTSVRSLSEYRTAIPSWWCNFEVQGSHGWCSRRYALCDIEPGTTQQKVVRRRACDIKEVASICSVHSARPRLPGDASCNKGTLANVR